MDFFTSPKAKTAINAALSSDIYINYKSEYIKNPHSEH